MYIPNPIKSWVIFSLALCCPLFLLAQTLVADIHQGREGYNPRTFMLGQNSFLFVTADPNQTGFTGKGEALYKNDGTTAGTKAIFGTAPEHQGGKIWQCTILGDEAYFGFYLKKSISIIKVNLLNDAVSVVKQYETRLTEHELFYLNFTQYQGLTYFFFKNELSAFELWKTKGNEESTALVYTFPGGENIYEAFRTNKCIFFESTNKQNFTQLWRVNLELEKTEPLIVFKQWGLRQAQIMHDCIIFRNEESSRLLGTRFFAIDELSPAPTLILQTNPTPETQIATQFLGRSNGLVYYEIRELYSKNDWGPAERISCTIWETNGTVEGTKKVFTLPEEASSMTSAQFIHEDHLYFFINTPKSIEWFCRINLAKPESLEKILQCSSYGYESLGVQGKYFYFFSRSSKKLLQSDGTPSGSKLLSIEVNFIEDLSGTHGSKEIVLNDDFYYFNRKDQSPLQKTSLLKMSIATGKTNVVFDGLNTNHQAYTTKPVIKVWQGKLLINADDPGEGTSLWMLEHDGTLKKVDGVPQRPKGSTPHSLNYFNGQLYFVAKDPQFGFKLRSTIPGTNQIKTTLINNLCPDCRSEYGPIINRAIDSALYISEEAKYKPYTRNIFSWKIEKGSFNQPKKAPNSDSLHHYFIGNRGMIPISDFAAYKLKKGLKTTTEHLLKVDALLPEPFSQWSDFAVLDNGYALLLAEKEKNNPNKSLFLTDGSNKGTFLVKEGIFNKWRGASIVNGEMAPKIKNKYFVYFSDDQHGTELWTFDLATRTLTFLKDLTPGQDGSIFTGSACLGNKCFFLCKDAKGPKFWSSDGTSNGTISLDSLFAKHPKYKDYEKTRFELFDPFTLGKYIFFNLRVGTKFAQLWRTDGTPEGTIPLSDNIEITHPQKFFYLGPHIYYFQKSPTHGEELWRTDGAAEGTEMIFDLNPGPASSSPRQLTQIGDEVYFSADDGIHGTELFKFKPAEVGTQTPKPYVGKWEKTNQKYILNYQDLRDQKAFSHTLCSSAGEIVEVQPIFEKNKVTIGTQKCTSGTYWLVVSNSKQKWMEAIIVD